jgi:hypothetical protein
VLTIALAGCSSSDGRSLPPPNPSTTTSTATTTTAPALGAGGAGGVTEVFSISSPAFAPGGEIPAAHTCSGAGTSPPLLWASTPPAAELAIVVRDPGADGFVHWVVTSIDPAVQGLGEDGVPEGAVEATNSAGSVGWAPPCPPAGSGVHTYEFTIYALPEPLALAAGTPPAEAVGLVEGAAAQVATITATATAAS